MRAVVVLVGLISVAGCEGKRAGERGTPLARADAKTHLNDPLNKPAFEAAVMGRSTREVAELLGPPVQTLRGEAGLWWLYPIAPSPDGKAWRTTVTLIIENDHVAQVDWPATASPSPKREKVKKVSPNRE